MAKAGKFVLMVGDEGAILTYLQAGKVVRRLFAASTNYTDTRGFLECFEADPKAPIALLVDFMDQSYVQQSLPPVSSLSINNLIKRKMDRDFAKDDLKGALRIGREKEGRRDWKYLFVTLSNSPQLQAWLDLVLELPNHFQGIYLLPVECEPFLHQLDYAVTGRKHGKPKKDAEPGPEWMLLVTHNKVGGFRQVVLRKGKLIFARLAQPIGDSQPAVVAGSIEQEISVTIEYLKRLGFTEDQGINVFIVVSDAIKNSLDVKNFSATQSYLFSPHELASVMGYEQVTEPQDQFADVILSAAFSRAKKRMLALHTKASAQLNGLYAAITVVRIAGTLALLAILGFAGMQALALPGLLEEIATAESQEQSAQREFNAAKEKEQELPEDLDKITDLVAMHQLLNETGPTPFDQIKPYREATEGYQVRATELTWKNEGSQLTDAKGKVAPGAAAKKPISMKVALDAFETSLGTDGFNQRMDALEKTLQTSLAKFEVRFTNPRPGIQETEKLQIAIEDTGDPLLAEKSYPMVLEVTGPIPEEGKPEEGKPEAKLGGKRR